ncbi:hypothetical protein FA95DRAFT_1611957 [Auriscalpium vulgare]|uniref:Uncharacterized protein n=1 Tax=Auriscalpium vulgare TaxID=40419 RepID=A0ACB8R8L4_9AGAM|nr:hypothetical protein FA95DRAFT_1611957 [Auriscalpium vulgare]
MSGQSRQLPQQPWRLCFLTCHRFAANPSTRRRSYSGLHHLGLVLRNATPTNSHEKSPTFSLSDVLRASHHSRHAFILQIDRLTLRACSLVCKGWTAHAQRLIFHSIYGEVCRTRFARLLHALQQSTLLAAYVRRIDSELSLSAEPWYCTMTDKVLELLQLCPNVTSLHLSPVDTISLVERMRVMDLRLTHLRICDTLARIATVLRLWPDLQCLEMYNRPPHLIPRLCRTAENTAECRVALGSGAASKPVTRGSWHVRTA